MKSDLNWRVILLGIIVAVFGAAATPYIVLKLGQSADLSYGAMFLAAAVLGRRAKGTRLAIQLNLIQTMVNAATGIGFTCVILAAFHYIQVVFGRDIGFHPTWIQMTLWVLVSSILGIFMGTIPRRMILDDKRLTWPTGKAVLGVAQTLTDEEQGETNLIRRTVLYMSTAVAAFLTFLKTGLGVITDMVGNASLNMTMGLELAAIGMGMLIPISVALSGLVGVWIIYEFGDIVSRLSALAGANPEHFGQCLVTLKTFGELAVDEKSGVLSFLSSHCGKNATEWVTNPSHFKFVVQWMMWPATAMMIASALTSVSISIWSMFKSRQNRNPEDVSPENPNEHVPMVWTIVGITSCVAILIWLQYAWFNMPWEQVMVAVALQPILIIAGAQVLGLTGQGPVSLMANATQFMFGLIWPAHIQQNLNAARISADPQSSSESTIVSFWIARIIGGRFTTLIIAQIIVLPICAMLLYPVFNQMVIQYGIGPGKLLAPTGLKIASLAMVMEQGIDALPRGALMISIVAALLGVVFELLRRVYIKNTKGDTLVNDDGGNKLRFWWIPVPAALGFSLILPPGLTIATTIGCVIATVWKKFAPGPNGSCEKFATPIAAGLIVGEAFVAAILLPILSILMEFVKKLLP